MVQLPGTPADEGVATSAGLSEPSFEPQEASLSREPVAQEPVAQEPVAQEPQAQPEEAASGRVSAITGEAEVSKPGAAQEPGAADQFGPEVIPGSGIFMLLSESEDPQAAIQRMAQQGKLTFEDPSDQQSRPGAADHGLGFLYGLQSTMLDTGFTIIGGFAGAATSPATGPSGPLLGAMGGYEVGQQVRRLFDVPRPEDLPPELRAGAYAGEAAGAGSLFSALPRFLAARGAQFPDSFVGNWLNKVIDKARTSPAQYAAIEAQITAGAALGEGVAETVWPGETGKRMAASAAGAFVNYPARALVGKSQEAISFLSLKTGIGSLGAEDAAARDLQRVIREAGENPTLVAKALRQARPTGSQTAAQSVPSTGLARMEASLNTKVGWYSAESSRRAKESFEILRDSIGALEMFGDPQSLRQASMLKTKYYEGLIGYRLALAEAQAIDAAQRIPLSSPAESLKLKTRVGQILGEALDDARAVEREMWGAIQHKDVMPDTVIWRLEEILDERVLPGTADSIRKTIQGIVGGELDEVVVTSKDLLKLRSEMLNQARKSASGVSPDMQAAAIYGEVAEAVLEDLGRLPGAAEARAYSRALNDVFTRTYVGEVAMRRAPQGGLRLHPEQILGKATAGTAERFDIRLQELDAALRFNHEHTSLANKAIVARAMDEMLDIQQRLLRQGAAATIDKNGLVNTAALTRFRREYRNVLERMPELDEVLKNADTAQRYFDEVRGQATRGLRVLHERAAFAKVARMEIPQQGIESVLQGSTPMRGYKQLAQLARSAGPDEVAGLKRSTLDVALHRAGGSDGTFSFERFHKELFEPRRVGEQPLADLMRETKVITKAQYDRLAKISREARNIEFSIHNQALTGESIESARSMLEDFTVSVIGARAGAKSMFAHQSGATLVAAAMGRRVTHHLHYKLPGARITDVIAGAMTSPETAALLLERQLPDLRHQLRATRQFYGVLLAEGIMDFAPGMYEEAEARIRQADAEGLLSVHEEGAPGEPQWDEPAGF